MVFSWSLKKYDTASTGVFTKGHGFSLSVHVGLGGYLMGLDSRRVGLQDTLNHNHNQNSEQVIKSVDTFVYSNGNNSH